MDSINPARHLEDSIVLVEPDQMASFQKLLDSLNKKALKFGLDPIQVLDTKVVLYKRVYRDVGASGDVQETFLRPVPDDEDVEHPVRLNRIRIQYPQIKLGNWHVVGKLEALEESNLLFTVTADAADQAAVRDRSAHPIECDHCKTKRKRNDGYILKEADSGKYTQVGSNCLEDFTGIDPGAALFLTKMYDLLRICDDNLDSWEKSGAVNCVGTRMYLSNVSYLSERFGFLSSAKARDGDGEATWSQAMGLEAALRNQGSTSPEVARYYSEREKHLAIADAIREWVAGKPHDSDFDTNVKLLLASDNIAYKRKHLAFAAAAVPMYNRFLNVQLQRSTPSSHVGVPAQKMAGQHLAVDRVVDLPNNFGPGVVHLVLMRDRDGNRFAWKSAAVPDDILKSRDQFMDVSFRVKEHDIYKDVKRTIVTHLKFSAWLKEPETCEPLSQEGAVLDELDANAKRVAMAFIEELRGAVTPDQFSEICRLNAAETFRQRCHSHDYADAVSLMNDAFEATMSEVLMVGNEEHRGIWRDAWSYAIEGLVAEDIKGLDVVAQPAAEVSVVEVVSMPRSCVQEDSNTPQM